jgi:hypothetical protein
MGLAVLASVFQTLTAAVPAKAVVVAVVEVPDVLVQEVRFVQKLDRFLNLSFNRGPINVDAVRLVRLAQKATSPLVLGAATLVVQFASPSSNS